MLIGWNWSPVTTPSISSGISYKSVTASFHQKQKILVIFSDEQLGISCIIQTSQFLYNSPWNRVLSPSFLCGRLHRPFSFINISKSPFTTFLYIVWYIYLESARCWDVQPGKEIRYAANTMVDWNLGWRRRKRESENTPRLDFPNGRISPRRNGCPTCRIILYHRRIVAFVFFPGYFNNFL